VPEQQARRRGRRILVVDDEPHIRRVLNTILTNDGFDVVEAMDGSAGMEAVKSDAKFDFILLDFMMPGATGLEVLARIRASEHRAETR